MSARWASERPLQKCSRMKFKEPVMLPPYLRPDEEALIEAVLTWGAMERRLHGHLPDLPVRVSTIGGEVLVLCPPDVMPEDDDDTVLRFRNIELT